MEENGVVRGGKGFIKFILFFQTVVIMNILSVGCGYIGSVLAEELIQNLDFDRLTICDREKENLEKIANKLGEKVHPLQLDFSEYSNLLEIIEEADLVIG
ncbi:saccharopine dehydrogenase NADP-binding domain-containing protein, partial [Candidatus Bathyarchaeota archaeon]|nr:saccharopine dehydrogenase NADP-binding domain-containing protein [Candidatus Bathyarchaeota archaeon]